jgi:sugar/nucleoside kinase (ribokinase family)
MISQYAITGLGFCSWDYVCAIPRVPVDGKVQILRRQNQGGGPAATAVFAAQRLGAKTAFIGVTGDDEGGRGILAEFHACGVDTSAMKIRTRAESSVSFCWAEQATGHRSIAWAHGTALPLRPEEVDLAVVRASRALHLDGHQTFAALHAATAARDAGVVVCLDAGTVLPGIDELLGRCDIVIASERFAHEFTGCREVGDALKALHQRGPRLTVITEGARGSIGHDGRTFVRTPAFPVRVVDSTGAGDVYHGAFLCRHLEGGTLAESMRFASAAAALKCEDLGGRAGIPTRGRLDEFLSTYHATPE